MRRTALLFLLVLFLTGCGASKSFVRFEVLEPAPITYPEYVSKTGFLNRAPYSMTILPEYNRLNIGSEGLFIIDTIIIENLKKGFLEARNEGEVSFLDDITFIDKRRKDTIQAADPLSGHELTLLFENYGMDALIVLEYYNLSLSKSSVFFSYIDFTYVEVYSYFLEALWRVYDRYDPSPIDEYLLSDTLYFENKSSDASSSFVTPTIVLREGSADFGFKYGLRHSPLWHEVSRVVFRGGDPLLVKAAEFTDAGNWDEAVRIWEGLLNSKDNKVAAKASHNLGVNYELLDQIKTASEYVDSASALWDNSYTEKYRIALKHRLDNMEKLRKQLR